MGPHPDQSILVFSKDECKILYLGQPWDCEELHRVRFYPECLSQVLTKIYSYQQKAEATTLCLRWLMLKLRCC